MHELAPLIKDLAIILGISGFVAIICQKIKQPVVLGYLLAGVFLGPYTPPYALLQDLPNIKILSELGVIFLMFALGLEFSFQKLKQVGFSASITGIWEVLGMLLLGFVVGLLLGWPFFDSLFLGAALSISSTTIIIKALEELKLKHERSSEVIFGVLIVEDLLAILLLVGLSIIVTTSRIFSFELVGAMLQLILVVGGWFLLGYFLVPTLFRLLTPYLNEENLILVSTALCLFLVCVADYFHYSTALGAFIMGSILAETTFIHHIEKLVLPIRNIFAAVFFVSVGMLIDPLVILEHWPVVLLLCFVTILGKLFITSSGAFLSGQGLNNSLRIGLSMAQIGEFSFIIIGLGLALDVISADLYPIIVGVSALTAFSTPYSIRFSGTISQQIDKHLPPRLQYFASSYTEWMRNNLTNPSQRPQYRKSMLRLFANGVIVAIVFLAVETEVLPHFITLINPTWLEKLLAWFLAILLASPFIWGMLSAFQTRKPKNKKEAVQITPIMQLSWLLTVFELIALSIAYFDNWLVTAFLLFAAITFFALLYKQLGKSYQWFERQLIENLQHPTELHEPHAPASSRDAELIELEVDENSPLVGTAIQQKKLRAQFGINVVAIARGTQVSLLSQGSFLIEPKDRLFVIGDNKNIDNFCRSLSLNLTI